MVDPLPIAVDMFSAPPPPSSSTAPLSTAFFLKSHGSKTLLTYQTFRVELFPDDAKDKVFLAIIKALLRQGNRPCTPKELSNLILRHKLTTLGGATPYATVSSRISQHFKRATDLNRLPLLGRRSMDGNSRRLVYYVDQPGVPVRPYDGPQKSDESDESIPEGAENVDSLPSSLGSSPVLPAASVESPPPLTGLEGNVQPAAQEAPANTDVSATPVRVSSRVKRRRSPYSPPLDVPQAQVKRSRSGSLVSQNAPPTTRRSISVIPGTNIQAENIDSDDDDEVIIVNVRDSAIPHRGILPSTASNAVPSVCAGSDGDTTTSPSNILDVAESKVQRSRVGSSSETGSSEAYQDFHEDMMKIVSIRSRPQPPPHPHYPHTQYPHSTQSRQRVASDEFFLKPISSPQIPSFQNTLPSKLSPSRPHLGFETSDHSIPSPLLDPEVDPLQMDVSDNSGQPKAENFRIGVGSRQPFGFGYNEFHHPEDMSVSELDVLLGEDQSLWGSWEEMADVRKRASEPITDKPEGEQTAKRRKVEQACQEEQVVIVEVRRDDDDASGSGGMGEGGTAPAPSNTTNNPNDQASNSTSVSQQPSAPQQSSGTSRPSLPEKPVTSSNSLYSHTATTSHTPSPPHSPQNQTPTAISCPHLSIASYRCNGDTLEIYEGAHDPIATRMSKIKAAPRMDLLMRTLMVDSTGRTAAVGSSGELEERKVGIRMEGYIRAKELFDVGPPGGVVVRDSDASVASDNAAATLDETVWLAYTEEIRRRAGSRGADESGVIKVVGNGADDSHLFVVLKGSDVEGDGVVPVECGGVWIPTSEARRLAERLGVTSQFAELLNIGSESNDGQVETLPPLSALISPKLPPLPSTPTRPSARSLPSPASTPIPTAMNGKVQEMTLGPAMLGDDLSGADNAQDFLDFAGDGPDWSQDDGASIATGSENGDDGHGGADATAATDLPVSIDPTRLTLIPPTGNVGNSGMPLYMANIDGVLVYITWLVKGADGGLVSPGREVASPLENVVSAPPQQAQQQQEQQHQSQPQQQSLQQAQIETQQHQPQPQAVQTSSTPVPPPLSSTPAVPLLRRVDNNMINATLLLHAGGLMTDRERSIVLSLERCRARCRKKGSGLYGTWIPLGRARHLATTCRLDSRLGLFLSDGIAKVAFGIENISAILGQKSSSGDGTASVSSSSNVQPNGSDAAQAVDPNASGLSPAAAALAASKAAMLGLTSLPPSVASGLAMASLANANGDNSVRGMLAGVRARGRGRPPIRHPFPATGAVSGRSFMGGRVGSLPGSNPSGNVGQSSFGTTTASLASLAAIATSNPSAMAATQAAIAALSKLGGNGPITAQALANALAALNQVIPQNIAANQAKGANAPATNGAVGTPNSVAGAPPVQGDSATATTASATSAAPATVSTPGILQVFANVFKNGFPNNWKPAVGTTTQPFMTMSASSSATPSTSGFSHSQMQMESKPFMSNSAPMTTQGVVARALAAAGAGRGSGLSSPNFPNPISIQTNALAGLPNLSLNNTPTAAFPFLPFNTSSSSSHQSASLPLLTPPTVPLIALDDIDGDVGGAIASPKVLAAAAAAAGVALPVGVDLTEDVPQKRTESPSLSGKTRPGSAGSNGSNHAMRNSVEQTKDTGAADEDDDEEEEEEESDGELQSTGGKTAPRSMGGGKVRPKMTVSTPAANTRRNGNGGKTRGGTATGSRSARGATKQPRKSTPATKRGTRGSRGKLRGGGAKTNPRDLHLNGGEVVVVGRAQGESEGSDFEIDVVDGDGVDDFR